MQIRVLGHLEVTVDDRPVVLGGPKQRAVLAMLGLEANRTVTADRLAEGLWGEEPPASAGKMVQNYVWRLRHALPDDGGAAILTHGRGYELRIDPELVDVRRLERLVAEASRDGTARDPGHAAREALALFRGEPLADLADEPFATSEIPRLEGLRETAAGLAIDADLASGRHLEVIGEIEALLARNPLRERLHAQRMLALYRCGRQAEALESYQHARRTLVDEIGVEPGPELRRLHEAILRQDPALDVKPAAVELPPELDAADAPPLIGRDGELRRLRVRWQRAAGGVGALVALAGGRGTGKTRIAAALASEVHREGAPVRYASGTGPPEAALAAIAQIRDEQRPALLVLDDIDRAAADVLAALRELARTLGRLPVLVLATGDDLDGLAPHDALRLEPLDADAVRAIGGLYAPAGTRRSRRGAAGRQRRRCPERPRAGERLGAARGHPPGRRGRRPRGGRGQRGARAVGRACGPRRLPAGGARAGRPDRAPGRRSDGAVPLQGPGDLRRRRRRLLLRPRGARRRARRTARRRAAARRRRPVRKRQVVRGPGGSPARAGRRGPARQRRLGARADASRRAPDARVPPCDRPAGSPPGARRRPARGAVHRLPRRGTSGPGSSRRWCMRCETRAPSSCSPCVPTSTAAAPHIRSSLISSGPTTSSSAR